MLSLDTKIPEYYKYCILCLIFLVLGAGKQFALGNNSFGMAYLIGCIPVFWDAYKISIHD